jgi:hypothetical protein
LTNDDLVDVVEFIPIYTKVERGSGERIPSSAISTSLNKGSNLGPPGMAILRALLVNIA